MIKGVNRRIVEVSFPESAYFEKAVVFLRTDCLPVSGVKLYEEAKEGISELEKEIARGNVCSFRRIGAAIVNITKITARMAVIFCAVYIAVKITL